VSRFKIYYRWKDRHENWIVETIGEIVKLPSNIKDLKKKFRKAYDELKEVKLIEYLKNDSKAEDLKFITDGLENLITFKEFMGKDFKDQNKETISSALIYVNKLIESKINKNPFLEFKNENKDLLNIGKTKNRGGTGSNYDDDIDKTKISNLFVKFGTSEGDPSSDDTKNLWNQLYSIIFGHVDEKGNSERFNEVLEAYDQLYGNQHLESICLNAKNLNNNFKYDDVFSLLNDLYSKFGIGNYINHGHKID